MASTNQYIDRLKDIRDKYGVSQTKNYPNHQLKSYSDHQQVLDRYPRNGYLKSELYGIENKKFNDVTINPSSAKQPSKAEYGARPLSSLGLSSQDYSGVNDYSRKIEKEKEIDQVKDTYAASRKKLTEDFEAKKYSRNFSKDVPRAFPNDFTRETREVRGIDLCGDYSRGKEDFRNPEMVRGLGGNRYNHSHTIMEKSDEYISPMKRITEYEEKKSCFQNEFESSSDKFWREREAKLAELTSNKLNESERISLFKDLKSSDYKNSPIKRAELYTEPHMKSYSDFHVSSKMDFENRPGDYSPSLRKNEYPTLARHIDYSQSAKPSEYSASNIDRIQQRIQSILGKR